MSNITISSTYKNAWQKLRGSKRAIWSIAAVIILIAITVAYISNLIVTTSQTLHYWVSYIILPIILYLFIGPFAGGSLMTAIKCCRNEAVNIGTGYRYLSRFVRTSITMVIISLLSNLITIIINIPVIGQSLGRSLPYLDLVGALFSIFIYAFFLLSIPLVVDKDYGIGKALSHSLQQMKSHWLRTFIIFFFAYLILFILYIPAAIGLVVANKWLIISGGIFFIITLIWFLPFLFLLAGNIYHQIVDGNSKPINQL